MKPAALALGAVLLVLALSNRPGAPNSKPKDVGGAGVDQDPTSLAQFKALNALLGQKSDGELGDVSTTRGLLYKIMLANASTLEKAELLTLVNGIPDIIQSGAALVAWVKENTGTFNVQQYADAIWEMYSQELAESDSDEESGLKEDPFHVPKATCEVKTFHHDAVAASLDFEQPKDYGLPMSEWAKLAATWNQMVADTHCWFLNDTVMAALNALPTPALWQNLGAPPAYVLAAAAELYFTRYGQWPSDWGQATAEVSFVQKHLL